MVIDPAMPKANAADVTRIVLQVYQPPLSDTEKSRISETLTLPDDYMPPWRRSSPQGLS